MKKAAPSRNKRLTKAAPIAVIDLGSNSIRLVVYDGLRRAPTPLFNEKVICGLGLEVARSGRLDPVVVEKVLVNLRRFVALVRDLGVKDLAILATAAVRDADNKDGFIAKVKKICGKRPLVIDGAREAELSALGVITGIPDAHGVMGDLGGGSLELVRINKGRIEDAVTLPLGPLALLAKHGTDRDAYVKAIAKSLDSVGWLEKVNGGAFYPVGGAWRNLARVDIEMHHYPLHVVQGYRMSASDAISLANLIAGLGPKSIAKIKGISRKRRDVVPLAADLLGAVLLRTNAKTVQFSATGLREGYLLDRLDTKQREKDPLIELCQEIAARESRFENPGDSLLQWTDVLFDDETKEQRRLRFAACLLSDTLWREHPDYRGQQAFRRIVHHPFLGISHPERVFLAEVVAMRYEGTNKNVDINALRRLITPLDRRRAAVIGVALKLGYALSGALPHRLTGCFLERGKKNRFSVHFPDRTVLQEGERVQDVVEELNIMMARYRSEAKKAS